MEEEKTEREICADGWLIYLSIYETFLEIYNSSPSSAAEFIKALGDYNFFGEDYLGNDLTAKLMLKQEKIHIDKQRERYAKSVHEGQQSENGREWDKIYAAARSGAYTTLKALGEAFGTSGQNIGKRLKGRGLTLQNLIALGPIETDSKQQAKSFETRNIHGFGETNYTNTNTNIIDVSPETNEPRVSTKPRSKKYSCKILMDMKDENENK